MTSQSRWTGARKRPSVGFLPPLSSSQGICSGSHDDYVFLVLCNAFFCSAEYPRRHSLSFPLHWFAQCLFPVPSWYTNLSCSLSSTHLLPLPATHTPSLSMPPHHPHQIILFPFIYCTLIVIVRTPFQPFIVFTAADHPPAPPPPPAPTSPPPADTTGITG